MIKILNTLNLINNMKNIKLAMAALLVVLSISSCKKDNIVVDKDPVTVAAAGFSLQNYTINYFLKPSGTDPLMIPVSVTDLSSVDRTVALTYTSPSGAVAGTHYTAAPSVLIKAGKLGDSLKITGNYAPYATGRVDTVKIKVTPNNFLGIYGKDSINLIIQRYCDVELDSLMRSYDSTKEYTSAGAFSYGPYSTGVNSLALNTNTSANGNFSNLYDDSWGDINFDMDWTNPSKFTVTIPLQPTGKANVNVRTTAPTVTKYSTFSSCDKTFTLYVDIVNDLGTVTTAGYKIVLRN